MRICVKCQDFCEEKADPEMMSNCGIKEEDLVTVTEQQYKDLTGGIQ